MKFNGTDIGERWFCPWCGKRSLEHEYKSLHVALCRICGRRFQVRVQALPDPNSKTGNKECGQKIRHETIDSAFQHADELRELPHKARRNLCIYRCRFCAKFHVGHKKKVQPRNEWYLFTVLKEQKQCEDKILGGN